MAFSVLVEQSSVVEVVSVFLTDLNLLESSGFLEDSFVENGVVQSRIVDGSVGVFFGQGQGVRCCQVQD